MPLRDHFHAPDNKLASWEEVHGLWPGIITLELNSVLPPGYRCGLKVHLGRIVEVDVAAFERDGAPEGERTSTDGTAWQAASPSVLLEDEELSPPEYEVRVYDEDRAQRLVAAIELISPGNKDRPQSRKAFVDKCHAMLQQEVCVVLVDPVTNVAANLYAELADRLGAARPALADATTYAVACRTRPGRRGVRVETWEHVLQVGAPLPTLPLWLREDLYVPLDLEKTYQDTCRGLRIG